MDTTSYLLLFINWFRCVLQALTMHYQSYVNIIKLVLAVDEEQFPDAHDLLDDFDESLRLIREAASEKQKDTQRTVSQ